jgi:hypothetical protein
MKYVFSLLMIVSQASFAIELNEADSIFSVTLPGGKLSWAENDRTQCLVFVAGQGVAIFEKWGFACDQSNYQSYLGQINQFQPVSMEEPGVYFGHYSMDVGAQNGIFIDTRKCDNSESSSAVFSGYHEAEYGTTFKCRKLK